MLSQTFNAKLIKATKGVKDLSYLAAVPLASLPDGFMPLDPFHLLFENLPKIMMLMIFTYQKRDSSVTVENDFEQVTATCGMQADHRREVTKRCESLQVPVDFGETPPDLVSKSTTMKGEAGKILVTVTAKALLFGVIPYALYLCLITIFLTVEEVYQFQVHKVALKRAQVVLLRALRELEKYAPVTLFKPSIHNLVHIIEMIPRFGPLPYFSMWCFERWNVWIKRDNKSHKHVEATIVNRSLARKHVSELQKRIPVQSASEKEYVRVYVRLF
jgi:hypothetical protein